MQGAEGAGVVEGGGGVEMEGMDGGEMGGEPRWSQARMCDFIWQAMHFCHGAAVEPRWNQVEPRWNQGGPQAEPSPHARFHGARPCIFATAPRWS